MTHATAIELGALARRERDLLLRLENTRERIQELMKEKVQQDRRGEKKGA